MSKEFEEDIKRTVKLIEEAMKNEDGRTCPPKE